MLLDIGAKTSNLLFFEKGKVYSRSINIGANSITQDFANEAKLGFKEAEAVKIEKGSVSLGGAYEEPEDPQAAAISKIARQVMTRLHIQVNQTIQFFRGQQGGSAPQQLFLSGGASIMPYTAQFFAEKLNLPVDYFNPFRNIEIDPALDLEELSKHAHSFGEVVGLGLRDLAHCPVELNLMPRSSIQRQEFAHKKFYLIASVFALAAVVFAIYLAEAHIGEVRHRKLEEIKGPLADLQAKSQKLQSELNDRATLKKDADQMETLAGNRFYWIKLLTDLRGVLMLAEASTKATLTTPENNGTNTDVGVWVETFSPVLPNGSPFAASGEGAGGGGGSSYGGYGRMDSSRMGGRRGFGMAGRGGPAPMAAPVAAPVGNEISAVSLLCRGVNREALSPTANSDLAYAVLQNLTNSQYFADKSAAGEKSALGDMKSEDNTNTFTFTLTVQLKHPFKL
jgi:type IV pilus assembly protein PilM